MSGDRIDVVGIEAFGYHGVLPEERRDGQRFVVDVALHLSTRRAAATGALADTVHYGEVALAARAAVERDPVDLVETVAERVADAVLAFPLVRAATVRLHKPDAPIGTSFADVVVEIHRRAPRADGAVVALGANLGDRAAALALAADALRALAEPGTLRLSPVVETAALTPHGVDPERPAYLNQVALLTTRQRPRELLRSLHAIEAALGRERREVWGDRTLDLDLVAHGDRVLDGPDLVLPHPRAHERDFVLGPWAALDPDAVLPGRGRVADLLAALPRA